MPGNDLVKALLPITSRVRTDVTAVKKAGGGQAWTREPLTEARLLKHLNGGPARGVCPIKAGESVTLCALLDLDSHKGETPWTGMTEAAAGVMVALEAAGMRPIPFRSSGGKGIHLFILWDDPQDAYSVRMALRGVLAGIGYSDGPDGVAKREIEVFPKQDSVSAEGFGNQFILPLAGLSEPLEPLLGLDPAGKDAAIGMEWPVSEPVPVLEKPVRELATGAVGVELRALQSALAAIPNEGEQELDYDAWRNVVFAIHAETDGSGDGLALAHAFSARSSKYDPDFLDNRVWPYITDKEGGITGRTILAMAREQGWVEDVSDEFEVIPFDTTEQGAEVPLPTFERNKDGSILSTLGNLNKALRRQDVCGFSLGFDTFRDDIMVAEREGEWRPFLDADYVRVRLTLEQRGFKPISREIIRDAVLLVADDNPFDSAVTWLEGLAWDGVSRVAGFLTRYFGAADTPYIQAVSTYLWTALAGRVLQPGVKADMVPILVGDQGLRKSAAVAAIAPHVDQFTEISLDFRDADLSRLIRGRLVGEIGELRGLHTKDLESIKSFITRTHENWVPKYREFAVNFPRRLVFIGTTNQEEFLADETGNRRWLPVRVERADTDGISAVREQLWAEGAAMFLAGGVAFSAAETLAPEVHAEHTIKDVWMSIIADWLQTPDLDGEKPANCEFLRACDVLRFALGFDSKTIRRSEEMRIGNVLRELGFERKKKRVNAKPEWVFVPTVPT